MEIERVTLVVKGSAKLTAPNDWQEQTKKEAEVVFFVASLISSSSCSREYILPR